MTNDMSTWHELSPEEQVDEAMKTARGILRAACNQFVRSPLPYADAWAAEEHRKRLAALLREMADDVAAGADVLWKPIRRPDAGP